MWYPQLICKARVAQLDPLKKKIIFINVLCALIAFYTVIIIPWYLGTRGAFKHPS